MKSIGKTKVIIIALLCLLTSTILIGCKNGNDLQQTQSPENEVEIDIKNLEQSISEYKNEIESLQTQNEFMNERNQYLMTIIKQIINDYSDEEMLEFSQNQFIYELQVNGLSIPKNGQVTIPAGDVEILVSEKSMGYDFLPREWLEKGKIRGNCIDHILNINTTIWTQSGTDGTVNTAQGYKTKNVKAGEHIFFNITDEIKGRLNLDTNLIQIEVN
ncbi:hypothetical protein [Bacillus sp. T3]|uniref:hypothetical protein n=1 Tax=Bacillus sp. T3 TaxID=467262 RepID=UPI00298293A8|nr:hypothetical protein [Bacillus sp. T3]